MSKQLSTQINLKTRNRYSFPSLAYGSKLKWRPQWGERADIANKVEKSDVKKSDIFADVVWECLSSLDHEDGAQSRNFWWLREAARGLTPIIALKSGSEVAHAKTDSDSVEGREMRRSKQLKSCMEFE